MNQAEPNDPKAVARRWFEECYGRGDEDVMRELAPGEWLLERSIPAQIAAFHEAFPDLLVTIEEQISEGDRVMTRAVFRGTHTGSLMGIAATGKSFEQALVEIHTVRDGRIVDTWNDFNPLTVLAQLGVIAPPD